MKKAFTMIELIFVIVVIGILAAVIIPSTRTNPLQEAAIQMLSHIRYTQHLALIDDKYGDQGSANWKYARWQIVFTANGSSYSNYEYAYTIFSDSLSYGGDASFGEIAKNPQNTDQIMTGGYGSGTMDITSTTFKGMKKLNLGMTYGISSVLLSGGCSGLNITFDSFGRPYDGKHDLGAGTDTHALIPTDCNIVLKDSADNNVTITIRAETGYASIDF